MDHSGKRSEKRWLRKAQVAARYGGVCGRTIDRAVEAGRLPPPKYPFGNRFPFWNIDDLDAHDRALASPNRPPAQPRQAALSQSGHVTTGATTTA
jgi:hypothetical protein